MQNKTNNMAQVAKTQQNKSKHTLPKSVRKKLALAHFQMYRAIFLKGLLSGMTIGAASHNASQFIKAKLSTMDANNPVTKFLIRIHKHRARRIAKRIMTSKNRDAVVAFMPENRAKFEAKIPQWINKAITVFNTLSTKYKPNTKPVTKAASQTTELKTVKDIKQQTMDMYSLAMLFRLALANKRKVK